MSLCDRSSLGLRLKVSAIETLFKFEPFFARATVNARKKIIDRSNSLGVKWEEHVDGMRRSMDQLEQHYENLLDPKVRYGSWQRFVCSRSCFHLSKLFVVTLEIIFSLVRVYDELFVPKLSFVFVQQWHRPSDIMSEQQPLVRSFLKLRVSGDTEQIRPFRTCLTNTPQFDFPLFHLDSSFQVSETTPDYYRAPFHCYPEGNLCWQAALEVDPSAIAVHANIYTPKGEFERDGDDKLRSNFHRRMREMLRVSEWVRVCVAWSEADWGGGGVVSLVSIARLASGKTLLIRGTERERRWLTSYAGSATGSSSRTCQRMRPDRTCRPQSLHRL